MYKYFTEEELVCRHCNEVGMDDEFMQKVDTLREKMGFSFPVNSAYRCKNHPIEARKAFPGAHASGRAIDIGVAGEEAYKLIQGALEAGFTGIGVSQKGTTRFIHLDNLENKNYRPRPHVWSY
tara:strand:- start:23 stop:391 length:369 start_codon:yes stop_codon:yes gene_type:complete